MAPKIVELSRLAGRLGAAISTLKEVEEIHLAAAPALQKNARDKRGISIDVPAGIVPEAVANPSHTYPLEIQ